MQRAINHYIKKRAGTMNKNLDENYINGAFKMIKLEIDQVTRTEINKAKEKKLREWRKREKLNCGHNNKRLGRLRR